MDYKKKLQSLCDEIDGAVGSFFCGFDGILIEQYKTPAITYDFDEIAANWADITSKLMHQDNMLSDFIATFEHNIIAIKPLGEDGFIGIVMSKDANIGRAKFELNKIRSEF